MAVTDRNNPTRQASSDSDYSLMEFMREYPDDSACLDRLWRERYAPDGHTADCPKCERPRRFHRTRTRASYTCDSCGLHVHPMKGTIFQKSTTSLHLWFYAMYLMASTRCGISAKQLERELGVTYETAHRMMKKIRTGLITDDGDEPLSGDVEADETSVRGRPRGPRMSRSEAAAWRQAQPAHTATVEGFFGNLKTGTRGAYKKVSPAYLQSYLNEYAWRYNQRHSGQAMFESLLLPAAGSWKLADLRSSSVARPRVQPRGRARSKKQG